MHMLTGCRAVVLNPEGTLCLTASSDQTIRLWDLGQQRCVQTFAVHTDSVWALHATPDFGTVYSGGRDACVYRCGSLFLRHS
jgi:WD repeat-containing protein 48